jgi:hypothetical protein
LKGLWSSTVQTSQSGERDAPRGSLVSGVCRVRDLRFVDSQRWGGATHALSEGQSLGAKHDINAEMDEKPFWALQAKPSLD